MLGLANAAVGARLARAEVGANVVGMDVIGGMDVGAGEIVGVGVPTSDGGGRGGVVMSCMAEVV